MNALNTAAPAVAMLAVFALAVFGIRFVWRGTDRRKGVLMLAMAAVLLGNVVVWTL